MRIYKVPKNLDKELVVLLGKVSILLDSFSLLLEKKLQDIYPKRHCEQRESRATEKFSHVHGGIPDYLKPFQN